MPPANHGGGGQHDWGLPGQRYADEREAVAHQTGGGNRPPLPQKTWHSDQSDGWATQGH